MFLKRIFAIACILALVLSALPVSAENADGKGFIWTDEAIKSHQYSVTAAEGGSYNIVIEYSNIGNELSGASRAVYFDGKLVATVQFPQQWEYIGKPTVKPNGDNVRPPQREAGNKMVIKVFDGSANMSTPVLLDCISGVHSVTLEYVYGSVCIYDIYLEKYEAVADYSKVSNNNSKYSSASERIYIEGEDVKYRSNSSVRTEYTSDPAATPNGDGNIVFNTVGGSRWNSANDAVTFEFDCKNAGLFKFSFRVYQKYTDGLPVFRSFYLDGKPMCSELLNYKFEFSDWSTVTLCDQNGEPFVFPIEKGMHTLEIRVTVEEYAEICTRLESALELLSNSVQRIIKITGMDPDINFDYQIDKKLPYLMGDLSKMNKIINEQCDKLEAISEKTPSGISSLRQIIYQVEIMLKNPFKIPSELEFLVNSQTTVSSWINSLNNQPLLIDYIEITPPEEEIIQKKSTFFERLWLSAKMFIESFTSDYGNISSAKGEKTIKIWISRGKEWGEILKQLSDENFTPETGIDVEMNILPSGQLGTSGVLLLALASGTQPDTALGSDQLLPVEYGMRGVMADLKQFEDYGTVSGKFPAGAMRPYCFEGAVYALPETIDMPVLYYRTDILENYGIPIADTKTWENLLNNVLPTLKQNGMDFGYTGGLNTFLYQYGGDFYNEKGTRSALDEPEALSAFKMFTNLYKIYSVPVAADFYTRFRSGQMPIGIGTLNTYILLQSAAPDLYSKWAVSVIPSTVRQDGTISHACSGATTSAVIFDGKNNAEAWEFLKWYTSADTQIRYSNELLSSIGESALWFSANIEALNQTQWNSDMKSVVAESLKEYTDCPNVVGGYITARHIENARVRVVVSGMNYREAMEISVADINSELTRKRKEFDVLKERRRAK